MFLHEDARGNCSLCVIRAVRSARNQGLVPGELGGTGLGEEPDSPSLL